MVGSVPVVVYSTFLVRLVRGVHVGILACVSPHLTHALSVSDNLSTHPPDPVDRVDASSRVLWFRDASIRDGLAASGRGYVLAQVVLVGR